MLNFLRSAIVFADKFCPSRHSCVFNKPERGGHQSGHRRPVAVPRKYLDKLKMQLPFNKTAFQTHVRGYRCSGGSHFCEEVLAWIWNT